jgi:hypothetical protein
MRIVGVKASEGWHRWSKEAANVDAVTAVVTFIFVVVRNILPTKMTQKYGLL